MRFNDNVFTIYHLMEKAGRFASNPANVDSMDLTTRKGLYSGPVQFPKMLYSPKGEYRITDPGQVVMDEYGKPQRVGQQRELVNKIVETHEEEVVLKALGWLDHPAKSIHAGGGEAPAVSSAEQVSNLEKQLEALRVQLEIAQANQGEPAEPSDEQKASAALADAKNPAKAQPQTVKITKVA